MPLEKEERDLRAEGKEREEEKVARDQQVDAGAAEAIATTRIVQKEKARASLDGLGPPNHIPSGIMEAQTKDS